LYPGIYTPPLPSWILAEARNEDPTVVQSMYLAKNTPPSGGSMATNAYMLNLGPEVNGGYIDAALLSSPSSTSSDAAVAAATQHLPSSWCGHLINHCGSTRRPNVEVRSFLWTRVLGEQQLWKSVLNDLGLDGDGQNNDGYDDDEVLRIPNTIRLDGSPWYFDTVSQKTVMLPQPQQRYQVSSLVPMLAGAAIVATTAKTSTDADEQQHEQQRPPLQPGDELFLNYSLKGPPYPDWAAEWYDE
jgi:hypothetical protein